MGLFMRPSHRLLLAALVVVLLGAPLLPAFAASSDYSNPDYAAYDADNMGRTTERQGYHLTTPGYWEASASTFLSTFLAGQARQSSDLLDGRAYVTLGQVLPGGNVGDPEAYDAGLRYEVDFLNREGAKLVGNIWPCRAAIAGKQAACPGVVITTGSIQVTQHMYGWLARSLQDAGYTAMTYDVRGQGESETTTHEPGAAPLANPQDQANFVNGTVDALRFLLSTPDHPYVPVGWNAARRAAANTLVNADDLEWSNPTPDALDPTRLALVGHSLGASAVSIVQQCSSAYPDRVVSDAQLPTGCAGQRFPIRAIAAFDALMGGVIPVVPAFDHRADGYFVNAVPTPTAPAPDDRTGPSSPYGQWQTAGVDACSITVRGGTHAEWSEIPYIVSATRYGMPQARYYVRAWFDRYLSATRTSDGFDALRSGPTPHEPAGQHLEQRASLFSAKYLSACRVASPASNGVAFAAVDLRRYAGVAAVGSWKAVTAEAEHGTQTQGTAHL